MRCAGALSVTVSPAPSVTLIVPDEALAALSDAVPRVIEALRDGGHDRE